MLRCQRIPAFGNSREPADASPERLIYHTDAWLRFIAQTHNEWRWLAHKVQHRTA